MKTYFKKTNLYKTTDIALTSALCCYGYQIETIDKQNPSKAFFLVKRDERLDSLIQQYFTHQLQIDPLMFFNFLKEMNYPTALKDGVYIIKTRIYNA